MTFEEDYAMSDFVSMSKEDVFSGDFFFVSYSGADFPAVREDVLALQNLHYRLWLDHKGAPAGADKDSFADYDCEHYVQWGSDWQREVEEAIMHENCKGAILYISKYSLVSRAVNLEHDLIYKKIEERGGDIKAYLISMNGTDSDGKPVMKDVDAHLRDAAKLALDDEVLKEYNSSRFKDDEYNDGDEPIRRKQKKRFSSTVDMIMRTTHEDCVKKLMSSLDAHGARDDLGITRRHLKNCGILDNEKSSVFELGRYKTALARGHLGIDRVGLNKLREKWYYVEEDGAGKKPVYETKPLRWRFLYQHEQTLVCICTDILAEARGGAGAVAALDAIRDGAFFGYAEDGDGFDLTGMVKCVRLFRESDKEHTDVGSLSLGTESGAREDLWWIADHGAYDELQMAYAGGVPIYQGMPKNTRLGIRPVLELSVTELKKYATSKKTT